MADTLASPFGVTTTPPPTGNINRVSNGAFLLNPEGAQTGADGSSCFVDWTRLSQSNPVRTLQLTVPEAGQARALRLIQVNASAQRMGVCQTLQSLNSIDLRTSQLAFGFRGRVSSDVRIMFAVLEWTGAVDTGPVDPIQDWNATAYIPGQFFKSTVNVLNFGFLAGPNSTWLSCPYIPYQAGTGTNNLYVVMWTEDAVDQGATLDLGLIQLTRGVDAQNFEYRSYGLEQASSQGIRPVINVTDPQWGAKCDAETVFDGAMANGSNLVSSVSTYFTSDIVGKKMSVRRAVPNALNSSWRPLIGTVVAVAMGIAQLDVTASAAGAASGAEVIWGTDDTVAIQSAIDYAATVRGSRDVYVPGHTITTEKLEFDCDWVRLTSDSGAHAVGGAAFDNDLAYSLSRMPNRIIWMGAESVWMTEFNVGQLPDGTWIKHQCNGLVNIAFDCNGRAAGYAQIFTQASLRWAQVLGARFTAQALDHGVTDVDHWGGNVASSYGIFDSLVHVNRSSNVFGGTALRVWGDKVLGNVNYTTWRSCQFILENDSTYTAISIENADTSKLINCVWNARCYLNSADSGVRSIWRGQQAGVELLANPSAPATQTVTVVAGGVYELSVVGAGSATSSNGTATITGAGAATAGSPNTFTASTAGTVNITVAAPLTSFSCEMLMRASQARTIQFIGGSGWVYVEGSSLGDDFATTGNAIICYDMENINVKPVFTSPGNGRCVVMVTQSTDALTGGYLYGLDPGAMITQITAPLAIPDATWTKIASWATPTLDDLDMWNAGSQHATAPNGVRWLQIEAGLLWQGNATGDRFLAIAKNGTRFIFDLRNAVTAGGDSTSNTLSRLIKCEPGDDYDVYAFQNSGGPLNLLESLTAVPSDSGTYFHVRAC